MSARLEVAVGVIVGADGTVLLGQRVAGKAYEGWWEFPGGKVEPGETVAAALARELAEELGLSVRCSHPWLVREFVYPHAHVRLHFRRLFVAWDDLSGAPRACEGQAFAWQPLAGPAVQPLLPASEPVFPWLRLPPFIPSWSPGQSSAALVAGAAAVLAAAGLQAQGPVTAPLALLALPPQPDAAALAAARAASAELAAAGVRLLVPMALGESLWRQTGAVLLDAAELGALSARPDVLCCAALCEDAAQIERAAELGLDFVISPSLPPAPRLPVYQALAGSAGKALRPAIEAGAHGLAQAAARQP
jgi:8-oxo-dGTP diphosphatase